MTHLLLSHREDPTQNNFESFRFVIADLRDNNRFYDFIGSYESKHAEVETLKYNLSLNGSGNRMVQTPEVNPRVT